MSPFHWVPQGLSAGASSWSLTPSIDEENMLSYTSAPPYMPSRPDQGQCHFCPSLIYKINLSHGHTSLPTIDNFTIRFHVY